MPLTLRYVARSDVGLVREGNEDSGYAGPYLLAVADGMGGHAAGEVASRAAIDELAHIDRPPSGADPLDVLSSAVTAANDRINQLAIDDPSYTGMGTTATTLLWNGSRLALGHIGDSRAYLLRDGTLTQITRDHTFVQSLVDDGRITPEDAREHPARSVVTKVLQGQAPIDPDFSIIDVQVGDRLLICSDGLSDFIDDDSIREVLAGTPVLDDVVDRLIAMVLDEGAPDNVTVVLAEVVEADETREPNDTAEAFLVGSVAENLLAATDTGDTGDPETMRYAPQAPHRRWWVRPAIAVGAAAVLVWAALTFANGWVREQYYVGNSNGQVAIYQGVRHELGPVRLSELYEVPGGLPLDALPSVYRAEVGETMAADGLDEAETMVETLRLRACRAHEPEAPMQNTGDSEPEGDWFDDVGFPGLVCADAAP